MITKPTAITPTKAEPTMVVMITSMCRWSMGSAIVDACGGRKSAVRSQSLTDAGSFMTPASHPNRLLVSTAGAASSVG